MDKSKEPPQSRSYLNGSIFLLKESDSNKTSSEEVQDIKKKIDHEKAFIQFFSAYRNIIGEEGGGLLERMAERRKEDSGIKGKTGDEYQADTSEDSFFIYVM